MRLEPLATFVGTRPWVAWLAYSVLVSAGYWVASHTPHTAPIPVPRGRLDNAVPLVPWAVVPYVSYLLLLPLFIASARTLTAFPRVFASALGCGLLNVAIYLAVPTALADRVKAPPDSLLAVLQRCDTPLCALPSGHVALPVAIAVGSMLAAVGERSPRQARRWRGIGAVWSIWTVVLAISALLTGQHYVVDVLAGLSFGVIVASLGSALRDVTRDGGHRVQIHAPTIWAFVAEWGVITTVMISALWWSNVATFLAAGIVIATRQHALLVLYHDGVHGLVARSQRLNDFLVNLAVGLPMMLPLHIYRPLHLSHHQHLGSEVDPEKVLLYHRQPWAYQPLALAALVRQLAGDLVGWRGVVLAVRYLRERRGTRLKLPRVRVYPELVPQVVFLIAAAGTCVLIDPSTVLRLALLWIIPYVTLTQLLQKIRSFAEHAQADAEPSLSCSWAPGLFGRLTIWPYNINYHREHHNRPEVPWSSLPKLFPGVRQRHGRELRSHVWNGALR